MGSELRGSDLSSSNPHTRLCCLSIYPFIQSFLCSFTHSFWKPKLTNTGFMLHVAIWKDTKLEKIPYPLPRHGKEKGSSQGRNFTLLARVWRALDLPPQLTWLSQEWLRCGAGAGFLCGRRFWAMVLKNNQPLS